MDQKRSKKELEALESFYVYCQPLELYNILDSRQQPLLLRRNLCYSASHHLARKKPQAVVASTQTQSLEVKIFEGPDNAASAPPDAKRHRSFVVALCSEQTPQAFTPLHAIILHVLENDPERQKVSGYIPVPQGARIDELALLVMARDDQPDLHILQKPSGTSFSTLVTADTAFRMFRRGEMLQWYCIRLAAKRATSLNDPLGLGQLQIRETASVTDMGRPSTSYSITLEDTGREDRGTAESVFIVRTRVCGQNRAGTPEAAAMLKPPTGPSTRSSHENPVCFRYLFDDDQRYYEEKTQHFSCPLCRLRCRNLWALQQHMEASHPLFSYSFPESHSESVPAVNVRCSLGGEMFNGDFLEDRNAMSKVLYYYCPKSLRQRRSSQQQTMAQRKKLPGQRPSVPKDVPKEGPPGIAPIKEESKVATKPKAKIRKPKANAAASQQAVVAVPGRQMFYHARGHMPMQDEEVKTLLADPWALPDSDDEEDLSEWKERCRRKLRTQADLSNLEREFMFNWNMFHHQHPIHADLQVPERCKTFAIAYADYMAKSEDLRKCYTSHLLVLWEYCLIDSAAVDECMVCIAAACDRLAAKQARR